MPFDSEVTEKSRDLIVLEKARALVARGWCKWAYTDDVGRHCATGALQVAGSYDVDHFNTVLGFRGPDECEPDGSPSWLTCWNDAPGRTQAEVLARFDAAIERLSQ